MHQVKGLFMEFWHEMKVALIGLIFSEQLSHISGDTVNTKEDIKEQPTSRNLSATATRVLQCTWPFAASLKDFSAIDT